MKPSMLIKRDYYGLMKEATIKFGSPPNNDVDIGRIESLKDLLRVITGTPKETYQCNNPKDLPTPYPERKYHYPWITGSGFRSRSKNFKTPFFSRYQKFLSWGNSNGSKTKPKFFSKFFLQQICLLEVCKVFAY